MSAHRIAMTSVFVANGLGSGAWIASLPRLLEESGMDKTQLGIVLLAVAAGASAGLPVSGALSARFGSGTVALVAGLALSVLLPALAAASGWTLFPAGAVMGVAFGAMDVAMNARGSEVEMLRGRPTMSSFHAGWSFGGLLGASLAGLLTAWGLGMVATLAMAGAAVAALTLPSLTLRGASAVRRQMFVRPGWALLGVSTLAGLGFVMEAAVSDWSGIYLHTDLGASTARAAGSFAAYSAAMVTGRLLGDGVVRRLGPARVVRGGGAVAAVGLAVALSVPGPVWAMAGFALVGLGLANIVPVVFSAAGRRAGAPGVAWAATFGYGGLMGAPPVVGFAADALGLRVALALLLVGAAAVMGLAPLAAYRPQAVPGRA